MANAFAEETPDERARDRWWSTVVARIFGFGGALMAIAEWHFLGL